MAAYYERMLVADIAALKALDTTTTPQIDDTIFIAVRNLGDGDPAWYYYDVTATEEELLPNIVTPTSGTGRWFLFSGKGLNGVTVLDVPNRKPLYINEIWTQLDLGSSGENTVNSVWLGVKTEGEINLGSGTGGIVNIVGGGAWQQIY